MGDRRLDRKFAIAVDISSNLGDNGIRLEV